MKKFNLHKSQVLFAFLVSFLIGTAIAAWVLAPSSFYWVLIILSILVIAVSSYHKVFGSSPRGVALRKWGMFFGFLLLFLCLAIVRFNSSYFNRQALLEFQDRLAKDQNVDATFGGYIDGEIISDGVRHHFPFKVNFVIAGTQAVLINEKTLVYVDSADKLNYGDRFLLTGSIQSPKNFDTFDYVSYLKKDGINTVVYNPKMGLLNEDLYLGFFEKIKIGIYRKTFSVKNNFKEAVSTSLAEPNASYVNGILLGSRENIPQDLKDKFNATGTSHVLAISGYNISILAVVLLSVLTLKLKRRKAFWLTVGIIILFTIMTGASSSVVRAALMGLLFLFASGYGRLYDSKNAILIAAVLMVLINPLVLRFDLGFQLSFIAVLGLIYIYPILNSYFRWNWPSVLKETLLMTLAAQITVAPMLIYYFKQFSIVSLPTNILILPFIPEVMLFGFLTGALGMIASILGKIVGVLAWALSSFQIKVVSYWGSISFSVINFSFSWWVLILIYTLMSGLVIWHYIKKGYEFA